MPTLISEDTGKGKMSSFICSKWVICEISECNCSLYLNFCDGRIMSNFMGQNVIFNQFVNIASPYESQFYSSYNICYSPAHYLEKGES